MKKLVIASAVAAVMASGVVAADTSVYGNIRLQVESAEQASMESGKLVIGFKASEDLGNGMTGYMQLEMEHDGADEHGAGLGWGNDRSFVGLKGDFGAVQLGVQGDAAGFACGGTDIFTNNSGAACGVGAVNGDLNNAIAYVKAAGDLTFVLAATLDGSQAVADDDLTHTIIAAQYAAGALSVGAQLTSLDGGEDISVIGGTYKAGDITIGLTLANDGNESATAFAVQMPVAGGTVKLGFDTGEDAGVADTTNLEFAKSLSKAVYTGVQFSSIDGAEDDELYGYIGYKF